VGKDEFLVAAFKIAQYCTASSKAGCPHIWDGVGREGLKVSMSPYTPPMRCFAAV